MEKATQARLNEVLRELYCAQRHEGVELISSTECDDDGYSNRVIHITDIDIYVKIIFFENSYGEDEIEGIEFVTPVEKVVTEFNTIQ